MSFGGSSSSTTDRDQAVLVLRGSLSSGRLRTALWSLDFFRCESILLKSYRVVVVMDVCTRRIIGFSVALAALDGPAICRMFNQ